MKVSEFVQQERKERTDLGSVFSRADRDYVPSRFSPGDRANYLREFMSEWGEAPADIINWDRIEFVPEQGLRFKPVPGCVLPEGVVSDFPGSAEAAGALGARRFYVLRRDIVFERAFESAINSGGCADRMWFLIPTGRGFVLPGKDSVLEPIVLVWDQTSHTLIIVKRRTTFEWCRKTETNVSKLWKSGVSIVDAKRVSISGEFFSGAIICITHDGHVFDRHEPWRNQSVLMDW